ncbi:hypothetical protein GQ54DRAFT_141261 [Martensiomyces pterosporus]|nr:hypothetical protein GQ54DRAFT_141261 [Martensiomyces pterosporus]
MGEHLRQDLLNRLRSTDAAERAAATAALRKQLADAEASGKHGGQNTIYMELNAMMVKLLRTTDLQDRLACTAILSVLVDVETLEDAQKTRMAVQLKTLLSGTDMAVCSEAVTIYSKLIKKRWAMASSSMEGEVKRSLEWLGSERNEVRRMTAVLILEASCKSAPMAMYSYVYKVLTTLSPPLRDHRVEMRVAASHALGACLNLISSRETNTKNQWYNYLFEEMHHDQRMNSVEGYHAALLICQQLIQYGSMFMRTHFGEVSDMVMRLKDHRDSVVHRAAIATLPVLARYSPSDFTRHVVGNEPLMARACNYLIGLSRSSDRDRGMAFLALGNIAQYCSTEFRPFTEMTTRAIRDTLIQRVKARVPPSETDETAAAILETIALLATAMGPALTRYVRDLLDLMFTTGLSQTLCDSLAVLEREVNQLSAAIQDRLLDMVSIILVNVPFRPIQPSLDNLEYRMGAMSMHYAAASSLHSAGDLAASNGAAGSGGAGSGANSSRDASGGTARDTASLVVSTASSTPVTTEILVLALHTLSSFNFSEENLSEFVRNDVLQYLSHSSSKVRKEAIYAVSHIVLSDPLYKTMAGAGVEVASEVVQRLIAAAVTDIDSDVRLMAVQMLEKGSCFDFHMGKAQNIQGLFLLLNDEIFEVRRTVLAVIGRLANMNPAHVMPSLRRMVVQLLTELEYARGNSEREECIQLLMVLVRAAENWVRPYVGDIFRTILPRIDDASPQLASRLLDTVAALARVGGNDLVPYLDKLLASIIQALGDQSSSQKRLSALQALGSCASFCGLVIDPYADYPQLFSMLTGMLKTERDEDIRLEVLRVIGALGAIDPHRYKDTMPNASKTGGNGVSTKTGTAGAKSAHHGKKHRRNGGGPPPNVMTVFNGEKPRESLVGDIPVDSYGTTFSGDAYYTSVSVNALLRILDDTTDTTFHRQATQALISMFGPLQNACSPYLESVVPAILRAMSAAPAGQAEFYIESLGRIVAIARQLIRPYLEPVFGLFSAEVPISAPQQTATIGLIEVLAEALSGDFGHHISTVLPFLIAVVDSDASENHQPTLRALHALRILGPSLDGYLFLVMPRLISLLDLTITPAGVIESALETIASIVTAVNCRSFASRIVLTLIRLLQCAPTQPLQTAVMDTLCSLMQQLQDDFALFMPTIGATLQKRGIAHHDRYELYSRQLFSGRLIPKDSQRVQPLLQGDASQPEAPLGQAGDTGRKLRVNVLSLRRAWSTTQRVSKEDWLGWLNQFGVELLQQSPSPALRACSNLAFKHPQLNSDLFNAAFVSCWTELPGQYQQEIITALQEVASNERVPADILQTILSLAEFMERDEKQIPIDLKLLGEYAERCHALAKELHYKEAEWTLEKNYDTIEKLIELNQNLDLHDAAIGMLNYVRKEQPDIQESVEWYQRLQRWDEALAIYRRQEEEQGRTYRNINSQIRCLFEMSDWDNLMPVIDRIWRDGDIQLRVASANIAMNMAWSVGDTDRMEEYMALLPSASKDRSFCRALLSVYRNKFDEAAEHIREARLDMESDLTAHLTESYSRGYMQVFRCQLLTELEEVVAFKSVHDNKERQTSIISTWRRRMGGIQQDVGMWQKLLRLRCMVVRPVLDLETWIKFVNMCRKSDQMKIAKQAIRTLIDDEAAYMDEINRSDIDSLPPKLAQQAQEYARLQLINSQQQQQQSQSLDFLISGSSSKLHPDSLGDRSHRLTNGSHSAISLDTAIRQSQQPALVYTYLKFKWADSDRRVAYQMLDMFANDYSSRLGFDVRTPDAFADHMDAGSLANLGGHAESVEEAENIRLLARFYFKKAEWLTSIQQNASLAQEAKTKAALGPNDAIYSQRFNRRESVGRRPGRGSVSAGSGNGFAAAGSAGGVGAAAPEVTEADRDAEFLYKMKGGRVNESILESYRAATVLDRKWYKAWHSLALRHYYETQRHDAENARIPEDIIEKHVVPAVHGFFRAIQLSKSDTTLQDTLRLLTAWFNYSQHESVAQAVLDGVNSVPIRTWLQVIPQILARIHIEFESTSRLIKQLLVEVGKFHPHAILFSLYVAARSDHLERSQAAKDVLAKLHDLSPEVVEETEIVSRELIRITLLFPEMWQEALDNASKCYYGQGDPVEMMKVLRPLHERARNPETLREYHFVQMFGNELAAAEEQTAQYFAAEPGKRNEAFMQQAWESYYIIFRRIHKLFPEPTSLALKDTAPTLLECRDMHLAVPGTYDPDRELVRIDSFDPVVFVYNTKQHPRRVNINGSDGNAYTFVLKGHEDLRQDERVMQLFGLINSLLSRDSETSRRSLTIERFPIIPLSSNSGLIGFYPNCETIHEIIRDYRESHNQPLNLEQRMALQFSPNWETLTVLQKVESFEYALSNTPGNDLQRAMWYKSPNAETWLERRTNYTRSVAVMSIAGYLLGLGDRHPSNIMMHAWTGKVVHIDFGDCFELAVHREKFPEKVPFRLTRMIIMPMEVSTIEGSFKFTANHTMRVLRANRDSLMAVLEAFVFDPLVSWSYIQDPENADGAGGAASGKKANSANATAATAATAAVGAAAAAGGTGNATNNQGQQLMNWNSKTKNTGTLGITGGSRPDDKISKAVKAKYTGLDDKGWQIGNPKARAIVKRILSKLLGTDFDPNVQLTVAAQIDKLIQQATSTENLAVLYGGWVPLW